MKSTATKFIERLSKKDLTSGAAASRSLWSDARVRFFKNKAAVVSVFVLILVTLYALFGGLFAQYSNEEIDWGLIGNIKEQGAPSWDNGHYFGVDELGRDLYARVVQGTQISLMVALVSTFIALGIGTVFGSLAGYYGGILDKVFLVVYEVIVGVPYIVFFVVLLAIFERTLTNILLVIGFISWSSLALLVRSQVILIKNKEFVDAARLFGLSAPLIIWRHILPNMLGMIMIATSIAIPNIILTESIISFLGVGIQEPDTSWGALISEGAANMQYGTLWQLAFPATFFALTQIAFYYIGDGLRDAFDPKDR